jgi:mRNA-degrading endonuclease toxin of MazEF toxin-antitoxin module
MTSGDILLCDLNPVAGREQGGVRPVVVVSHPGRRPHRAEEVSYAMTEQVHLNSRIGRGSTG